MLAHVVACQFLIVIYNIFCIKNGTNNVISAKRVSCVSLLISIFCAFVFFNSVVLNQYNDCTSFITLLYLKNIGIDFSIISNSLSITVGFIGCIISTLCHFYSIGFIRDKIVNYLLCINVFILIFLLFISSNNAFQIYIYWEILSIAIYFITYFDVKDNKNIFLNAFKMLKFCDVCFLVGCIFLYNILHTVNLDTISNLNILEQVKISELELISGLLFLSIFIKSGQRILNSVWYENIIHCVNIPSAVLITTLFIPSGIFILLKFQILFECSERIQSILIIASAISAISSSIMALKCCNVKSIISNIAVSFVSFMIIAYAFEAYGSLILLYISFVFVITILLFSVGSIIYALSGEDNINNMGGLLSTMPKTYYSFIVSALSLIGCPLVSCYYAKRNFINDIITNDTSLSIVGVSVFLAVSFMWTISIFKLIHSIFNKEINLDDVSIGYINEDQTYILNTIYVSMFFALFIGTIFYYIAYYEDIWKDIFVFSDIQNASTNLLFNIENAISVIAALFVYRLTIFYKFTNMNYVDEQMVNRKIRSLSKRIEYFFNRIEVLIHKKFISSTTIDFFKRVLCLAEKRYLLVVIVVFCAICFGIK